MAIVLYHLEGAVEDLTLPILELPIHFVFFFKKMLNVSLALQKHAVQCWIVSSSFAFFVIRLFFVACGSLCYFLGPSREAIEFLEGLGLKVLGAGLGPCDVSCLFLGFNV